jgi:hypothetical protein
MPGATSGEARLEQAAKPGWREAWPELEAKLSTAVLEAILAGLETNDPRMVQGITHLPTLATAPSNAPPTCGCLVGFGLWIGENLTTIGEVDGRFGEVNRSVPVAYRVFLAWDGSQGIAEARKLFLPVVRAAVERRKKAAERESAETGKAVPA